MNLADARSGLGFRWLERTRSTSYRDWFVQPWWAYSILQGLDLDLRSADLARGRRLLEAQERARAALALESFGRPDLAESQWSIAAQLVPSRSREQHREFGQVGGSMPGLEAAYLDSRTWQELNAALPEIRQELGAGDSN